ncbi:MAG: hypothetical protein IJZ68_08265 [Bacteroidaceae bacterium]|nr:hypothetical protein [Bacteroidaceae bacterium]
MKYKAKIIEIKPADPGYYYPTYEYTDENGTMQHFTDDNAMVVNPWDLQKTHELDIRDGKLYNNNAKGLIAALIIMGGFFVIGIFGPTLFSLISSNATQSFFGFLFAAMSLIPVFIFGKGSGIRRRRKKRARELSTTQGKIVWYKEVVRKSKNSTTTYHYPIVEYLYNGQTLSSQLPDHEDPEHIGETREFFIDMENQDVFTEKTYQAGGAIFGALFGIFFTLPFLLIGIAMMLPEGFVYDIFDAIINGANSGSIPKVDNIMEYAPLVFVGIFGIALFKPTATEVKKLLTISSACKNGNSAQATYIKTNDFGRREMRVYEYTYMGQTRTFQTAHRLENNIEVFIHPQTGVAYTKRDKVTQWVKIGILAFVITMMLLSLSTFQEAWK